MIGRLILPIAVFLMSILNYEQVQANLNEDKQIFLKAREAYRYKDIETLRQMEVELNEKNKILTPYVAYWRILQELSTYSQQQAMVSFTPYKSYFFYKVLMKEWGKELGRRGDWVNFFMQEIPQDQEIICYTTIGKMAQNERVDRDLIAQVLKTNLPLKACTNALTQLFQANQISTKDLWQRFRFLLRENKITLAQEWLKLLQIEDQKKRIQIIQANSQAFLKTIPRNILEVELWLYALHRTAQQKRTEKDFQELGTKLEQLQELDMEQKNYGWQDLAQQASYAHQPIALNFFERVHEGELSPSLQEWQARMALLTKNFKLLEKCILQMPEQLRQENVWRYWLARIFKEQGNINKANMIFTDIAQKRHFYGLLAKEELMDTDIKQDTIVPENMLKEITNSDIINRVMALTKIGELSYAMEELKLFIADIDDKKRIMLASYFMQQALYSFAIQAMEKTSQITNQELLYPTPYFEEMSFFAKKHNVDLAWMYGIMRQESYFSSHAHSHKGAGGLLQIMPDTAEWISKRLNLKGYQGNYQNDPIINIQLGTYYLRYLLDINTQNKVIASAAYNAGHGRIKAWAPGEQLESAIYIETIPFPETRLYVQKVLFNTYHYTHRLSGKTIAFKEWLGYVPNLPQD